MSDYPEFIEHDPLKESLKENEELKNKLEVVRGEVIYNSTVTKRYLDQLAELESENAKLQRQLEDAWETLVMVTDVPLEELKKILDMEDHD